VLDSGLLVLRERLETILVLAFVVGSYLVAEHVRIRLPRRRARAAARGPLVPTPSAHS